MVAAAAVEPKDVALGVGCLAVALCWCGFRAVGHVASIAIWFTAGVWSWSWAFTGAGRLRPREPVEDNVRVVRHMIFVILVLCLGSAVVGTVEALAATFIRPWWLQVPANVGLTLLAFVLGGRVFAFSHEWVLRDPRLEPPMWTLDACVVS